MNNDMNDTEIYNDYINNLLNENIKKVKFFNIENPLNITCPITREEFKHDDDVGIINHCNHIFCYDSLIDWIKVNFVCPMCRYDIRGTTHETLSYGEIMDRISEFLHSDISNNTGRSLLIRYSNRVRDNDTRDN